MSKSLKAVCYGEVLWDIFPDEKKIGGAPLNVASRLSSLGISTGMISSIGNDQKGKKIKTYLQKRSISTENITVQNEYPTGVVNVSLSVGGSATYEIAHPAAWDKIEIAGTMGSVVLESDAFIFGSLVCRDNISRNSLFKLLEIAPYKVFDINLRSPHYEKDLLIKLMQKADFIKFNDDELFEIAEMMGSKHNSLEQNLHFVSEQTNTRTICVTKGRHGAVLLKDEKRYYNSGFKTKVKDTVGAGDSFLASLIAGLLKNEDPQSSLDFACAVGALVAGEDGANPIIKKSYIQEFMFPG
ncbi:carbohydrate kinase family protein [Salegentibacter salegens]|uniref:Fructokinase n=1 Tax=Salegentibacter salegens TaxID=143223 RepID=A0A1M7MN44_9FLAO|nr:carbohydrate kinase [Salegentibacter salegens]PRX39217.1 fructokinase [Salegentibacter salegens]SHM92403.1 fructokinase [Salegentibacter salegens]